MECWIPHTGNLVMVSQRILKLDEMALKDHARFSEGFILHAMTDLANFYSLTDNIRIARLMTRIIKDERLTNDTRMIAYCLFLEIIGRVIEEMPAGQPFSFPESVNWSLVNRYGTIAGNVGLYCSRLWRIVTLRASAW